MFRNTKWFVVLGVIVLAFGLLFGTAMADPGDDDGEGAWHMHEQMSPELYAQMIQHMTEVHGAEFTAEMVQRMSEGGDCHDAGHGLMGTGMMNGRYGYGGMMGRYFDSTVNGYMRGVHGMVEGFSNNGEMMDNGFGSGMMNGGMMGR